MIVSGNVHITIDLNSRTYTFVIPDGSPFQDAYNVAQQLIAAIEDMAKKAAESAEGTSTSDNKQASEPAAEAA